MTDCPHGSYYDWGDQYGKTCPIYNPLEAGLVACTTVTKAYCTACPKGYFCPVPMGGDRSIATSPV